MIREPIPLEEPAPEKVPKGKGKKKVNKATTTHSRNSTPSPLRRVRREAKKNKLREEVWLQRQRNLTTGVGALEPRSSSISQEVEQYLW